MINKLLKKRLVRVSAADCNIPGWHGNGMIAERFFSYFRTIGNVNLYMLL